MSGAWNNPASNKSVMTPASSALGTHGSVLVRYSNGGEPQEGKRLSQEMDAGPSSIEESIIAGKMESVSLDGAEDMTEGTAPTEESAGR